MAGVIIVGVLIFLSLVDIHCDLKDINENLKKESDSENE